MCTLLQAPILLHNLFSVHTTSSVFTQPFQCLHNLTAPVQSLQASMQSPTTSSLFPLIASVTHTPNVLISPRVAPAIFLLILSISETSTPLRHYLYKLVIMLTVLGLLISVLIISLSPLPLMPRPSNAVQDK